MSYGHHLNQARNDLMDLLRDPPAPSLANTAARHLVLRQAGELIIMGGRPQASRRRAAPGRLATLLTHHSLPGENAPTDTITNPDADSRWTSAARHAVLATDDLRAYTRWQWETAERHTLTHDAAVLTRAAAVFDECVDGEDLTLLADQIRTDTEPATQPAIDALSRRPDQPTTDPAQGRALSAQQALPRLLDEPIAHPHLRAFALAQADISHHLADPGTRSGSFHNLRAAAYEKIFRNLRELGGNLGGGQRALGAARSAARSLRKATAGEAAFTAAFDTASRRVDAALSRAVVHGLHRGLYLVPADHRTLAWQRAGSHDRPAIFAGLDQLRRNHAPRPPRKPAEPSNRRQLADILNRPTQPPAPTRGPQR